jgi:hypothetical protein
MASPEWGVLPRLDLGLHELKLTSTVPIERSDVHLTMPDPSDGGTKP